MKKTMKLVAWLLCLGLLLGAVPLLSTATESAQADAAEADDLSADGFVPVGPVEPVDPAEPAYPGEYYDYPITLEKDRDAWIEAGSIENGGNGGWIEVCRIPEEILEILTTEQLLKSVIHYPLMWQIYAFDSCEQGLRFQIDGFNNGLEALLQREDFSTALAAYYCSLTSEDLAWRNNEAQENWFANTWVDYLEALVCVAAKDDLLTPMDSAVIDSQHERLAQALSVHGYSSKSAVRNALRTHAI